MDKLASLDSSRRNHLDYVISYFFQLHLMLHTCVRKFDVTGTAQTFLGTKRSLSAISVSVGGSLILPYSFNL